MDRPRFHWRARLRRVRVDWLLAAQSGLAAGLSWWVATDLITDGQPFFAPVAAVVVLSASVGQRLRRAVEMVLGVALGIAVGDALVYLIGVGPAQIGAVVALAIVTVIFLGGGNVAVGQAASSAVLVATIAPPENGIYYTRFFDALIGGVLGIAVMALLLPFNPLTVARRAAKPALDALESALGSTAEALQTKDRARAVESLHGLRGNESQLGELTNSLSIGREAARMAPLHWRTRPALEQYMTAAHHISRARRHIRVLVARAVPLLDDGEVVPGALPESLGLLAGAVARLRRDLADAHMDGSESEPLEAVRASAHAYADGVGFSGSVIIAQVQSAATELLRAAGVEHVEADRLVRRAAEAEAEE
jgi:uncharacterized membrane protein YgaE (UPF0421/DUF939 family)